MSTGHVEWTIKIKCNQDMLQKVYSMGNYRDIKKGLYDPNRLLLNKKRFPSSQWNKIL